MTKIPTNSRRRKRGKRCSRARATRRKLSRYVSEQRAILDHETTFEWLQWLAERTMEREKQTTTVPVHIVHREWKNRSGTQLLPNNQRQFPNCLGFASPTS